MFVAIRKRCCSTAPLTERTNRPHHRNGTNAAQRAPCARAAVGLTEEVLWITLQQWSYCPCWCCSRRSWERYACWYLRSPRTLERVWSASLHLGTSSRSQPVFHCSWTANAAPFIIKVAHSSGGASCTTIHRYCPRRPSDRSPTGAARSDVTRAPAAPRISGCGWPKRRGD